MVFKSSVNEEALITGTVNGYTAQQYAVQTSLTDASPITWDLNTHQAAYVLLTAAVGATRQLQNPTNMKAGGTYTLAIEQSSTGNNAMTFGTAYKTPGGAGITLSTAASAVDVITFLCVQTSTGTFMEMVGQSAFA